jgi:hypothetical protein
VPAAGGADAHGPRAGRDDNDDGPSAGRDDHDDGPGDHDDH